MTKLDAKKAGSAVYWKATQHVGEKVIFLIRLVVLARLLQPSDFGLLAISMVAIGIANQLTNLGMIPALVQRAKVDQTHYHTAWTVELIRAVVIAVAVFLSAPFVARLFNEPRATNIIQVLAILPLLKAAASIKVVDLVRDLNFRSVTLINLPGALANTIVAISLAPSLGVWALVIGTLAGPAAVLILSYFLAPWRPKFSFSRQAARALVKFGRWILFAGLLAVVGESLLRLIITRQLGTSELGLYFLAAKLAYLPAQMTSSIIRDVAFPLYARLQDNLPKVTRVFQSIIACKFALLAPVCTILIALAPPTVEHVFGHKWDGTAPVIRILAVASLLSLLGETFIPVLKGIGKPSRVLINMSIETPILISLAWLFTGVWGLAGAALASVPAVVISQLIYSKDAREILPHPFAGLGKSMFVIAMVSVGGALIAVGVYELFSGLIGLILGVFLAMPAVGWALWISDRRLALGLASDLQQAFPQFTTLVGSLPSKSAF